MSKRSIPLSLCFTQIRSYGTIACSKYKNYIGKSISKVLIKWHVAWCQLRFAYEEILCNYAYALDCDIVEHRDGEVSLTMLESRSPPKLSDSLAPDIIFVSSLEISSARSAIELIQNTVNSFLPPLL